MAGACFLLGELFFELGEFFVAETGGGFEVAASLGVFKLGAGLVDLFLEVFDVAEQACFCFPAGGEGAVLFGQVGELFFDLLQLEFGGVVGFFLECFTFDLQLHDFATYFIQVAGQRIVFDAQARGGFVDEVDGFVGQESVGDVAVGEGSGGDEGGVGDADAVVGVVAGFEAAKDGDGVFDAGLEHHDGLEASFEGGVFFDVLAVFVEGGGADAAELSAGEGGFEQVAGVDGTFGFAGADDEVQFVDEEDDLAIGFGDFFKDGFEAVFEFAAIFGAGDEGAHVEAYDTFVFEACGDVAVDDALGESFDDGGFADAGFADEDGVVFGASAEDLHAAADFVVAAYDGIEFAFAGLFDQVDAEAFEGLVFVFGVLVGDVLAFADVVHGGEEVFGGQAVDGEDFLGGAFDVGQGEQEVFGADVVVFEGVGLGLGLDEQLVEGLVGGELGGAGNTGQSAQLAIGHGADAAGLAPCLLQQGRGDAGLAVAEQGAQQVQGCQRAMACLGGDLLSGGDGFLGFYGEFVKTHRYCPPNLNVCASYTRYVRAW